MLLALRVWWSMTAQPPTRENTAHVGKVPLGQVAAVPRARVGGEQRVAYVGREEQEE